MARKKKQPEPEYMKAGIRDNLVKISIKSGVPMEQLRSLNPDIRNILYKIPAGKEVRIV